MRAWLVVGIADQRSRILSRETAAKMLNLPLDEIQYTLDEEGVCETDQYTIVDIIADSPAAAG